MQVVIELQKQAFNMIAASVPLTSYKVQHMCHKQQKLRWQVLLNVMHFHPKMRKLLMYMAPE